MRVVLKGCGGYQLSNSRRWCQGLVIKEKVRGITPYVLHLDTNVSHLDTNAPFCVVWPIMSARQLAKSGAKRLWCVYNRPI